MEIEEVEIEKLGDRTDPEAIEKRRRLKEKLKLKKDLIQSEAMFNEFVKDKIGYVTKYPDLTASYIERKLSEDIEIIKTKLKEVK